MHDLRGMPRRLRTGRAAVCVIAAAAALTATPAAAAATMAGHAAAGGWAAGSPAAGRTTGDGSGRDRTVRYFAVIRRTAYGIPHILARGYASLGYGYGYAFAQDNLCVMADMVVTGSVG